MKEILEDGDNGRGVRDIRQEKKREEGNERGAEARWQRPPQRERHCGTNKTEGSDRRRSRALKTQAEG